MKITGAHVVFHRLLKTSKTQHGSVSAVLLCKKTQDAPMHPGHWTLLGGTIEAGEQPKRAAIRECLEELGLTLKPRELSALCEVKRSREIGSTGAKYFRYALDVDMDELILQRDRQNDFVEGEGLGWFTAEEVHHLMVRPEDRVAISIFFARHGT